MVLQEELEGSKESALQGVQRRQKRKVKKCFCLPESCSHVHFNKDAGTECSCAACAAAPAHSTLPTSYRIRKNSAAL